MNRISEYRENFLSDPGVKIFYTLRFILTMCILFDQLLSKFALYSVEYIIPLKPFLLVLVSRSLRQTAGLFFISLYRARDVLVLFILIVMISSLTALSVFHNEVNAKIIPNGFDNYVRALLSTFVFITSGENYIDIVYPALSFNKASMVFFVFWAFMGMFFIVAMVTGYFQQDFSSMQKREFKYKNLRTRVGILAAFCLLDEDESGDINREEFSKFMFAVRPDETKQHVDSIFELLNYNIEQGTGEEKLDVKEFVDGVEQLSLRHLMTCEEDREIWLGNFLPILYLRTWVFERSQQKTVIIMMLFIDMLFISFYGLALTDEIIDAIGLHFMIFFNIEVLVRIFTFGFNEYWFQNFYHYPGLFQTLGNRSDLIIVISSMVTLTGILSTDIKLKRFWLRTSITIPLFRIFTTISSVRYLLFTLFRLLPMVATLWALLFIVFYFYGYIGMSNFAGIYYVLPDGIPYANFETLLDSIITLFQLAIGEGWHEILYNTILADGFGSSWYFISFIFLVQLLFMNLFIGLVLSAFEVFVFGDDEEREISSREFNLELEKR